MSCPIEIYINTIELTVNTSCYYILVTLGDYIGPKKIIEKSFVISQIIGSGKIDSFMWIELIIYLHWMLTKQLSKERWRENQQYCIHVCASITCSYCITVIYHDWQIEIIQATWSHIKKKIQYKYKERESAPPSSTHSTLTKQ